MVPGIVVRITAGSGLAGNPVGTLAVCWRSEGDGLAHFVFENGQLAPLGWNDFHRLTRLVGFDDVAAEALSELALPELTPTERRAEYLSLFARAWVPVEVPERIPV